MYSKLIKDSNEYFSKEIANSEKDVKSQANVLFQGSIAFGKRDTFRFAKEFAGGYRIYPCSFTVLKFLIDKSEKIQETYFADDIETMDKIKKLLKNQSSTRERLKILSMLRLTEKISLSEYRELISLDAYGDSPIVDNKRVGDGLKLPIIIPAVFVDFLNQYPYEDHDLIENTIPIGNYGLRLF